jgi:probable HAF family extracellular repeat protein
MKLMIGILAALLCASCGAGSASGTAAPAAAASPAAAVTAPASPPPSSASPSSSAPPPSSASPPATTSAAPSPAPSGAPLYKIVEIPRLAASGSVTASGVNDQGVVVGQLETTASPRAWMYQQSSGALDELTFDASESGAAPGSISDTGVIAGYEVPAGGPPVPGFWTATGGSMLLSGTYQSDAEAVAANGTGMVIGNYGQSGTVQSLPLVWTAPGYAESTLPGLPCNQCVRLSATASAVNDGGLVVGSSSYGIYDSSGNYLSSGLHAVEWRNGAITDLGGLQGADYSAAYAVNSSGDVVGASRVDQTSGAPTHAFLYHAGAMADLGTLPGDTDSSASSINDAGEIVGSSQGSTTSRAFLYESGHLYDLNALIDPASALAGQVSLEDAVGISSNGWIAVNGTDSRDPGWTRAFLLIPES